MAHIRVFINVNLVRVLTIVILIKQFSFEVIHVKMEAVIPWALQDVAENTQELVDALKNIALKDLEVNLVVKNSSGTKLPFFETANLISIPFELQLTPIAAIMKPFLALAMA